MALEINMIGVPIYYGADRRGPEYGPDKLRDKNIVQVISEHNHKVYDLGNLHVPYVKEYDKFHTHKNLKYLEAIVEVNRNLAHSVYSSLKAGCFPLILGGDHSLGLGSIAGASRACEDVAVIWVDAHGDINTQDTSETGNIHGMPLAKAMNIGYKDLINLYFEGQKVKPENVFIIGARDLDPGEIDLITKLQINVYSGEEIKKRGIDAVMKEVMKSLRSRDTKTVHLSFDIDFIDAEYVPGTGTPVHNGASIEDAKKLLRVLAESGLVGSMDFVELNVLLDKDDVTANLAIELLDWTFKYLQN